MKKFLLLMLVLGLATTAQAGLVFTVNGQPQPNTIILAPSEVVELDLELPEGSVRTYTLDYILSNAQARFITDGASGVYPDLPPMTDVNFPAVFELPSGVKINEPQHVQISGSQLFGDPLEAPQTIMNQLYIHCLELTPVILEIISNGSEIDGVTIPPGTLMHTLYIQQIPEPMTVALLGLGGLFALRRKKR